MKISDRTGSMPLNPKLSSVKDHSDECDAVLTFSISDFNILREKFFRSGS